MQERAIEQHVGIEIHMIEPRELERNPRLAGHCVDQREIDGCIGAMEFKHWNVNSLRIKQRRPGNGRLMPARNEGWVEAHDDPYPAVAGGGDDCGCPSKAESDRSNLLSIHPRLSAENSENSLHIACQSFEAERIIRQIGFLSVRI